MNIDEQRTHTYRGYTLVDITNTGITKFSAENEKSRNQQRNWETVLQILNMCTQIFRVEQNVLDKQDLRTYQFGEAYTGKQRVWAFEFDVELVDVVPLSDFDQVPIIVGLEETVKPSISLFYTAGINKNIYFTQV